MVPPYRIEFEEKASMDSKPLAYVEGETLHVVASTEPELKRLIGRFVIEQTWTPHEWLLVNHVGRYIATCLTLVSTLPTFFLLLSFLLSEFRLLIVVSTVGGMSIFTIWSAYQTSIRSVRLANQLVKEVVDIGCMTEYDAKYYEIDYHMVAISGVVICLWGGLALVIQGLTFYPQSSDFFMISLVIMMLPGVYYMFSSLYRAIDLDLCSSEYEEDLVEDEEYVEFEDNEYLTAEFTQVIERMDLKESIESKYDSKFHVVKGRYSKTDFAQCRWANDYIEDETLFVDCRDVSEAAARRYGSATLARGSIRYHTELNLKWQAIYLIAFLFGLVMWIVILVGAFVISKEFGLGSTIFTGVVFLALWRIGRKQNEEARSELPEALRKTGVFKEHEMEFYFDKMFPMSSKFDWGLLIGFQAITIAIGILILWLV
ncbi:MAG: hypothetical protein RTV41_13530 [Candidatus Thorarchaeota archaeon]